MNQIKFSHKYPKLWNQTTATLIMVRIIQAENISDDLKEYDTLWDDNGVIGYYPLPSKGQMLQLIFIGNKNIPFCTIRRWTPQKEYYYQKLIGHGFEVVLTSTTEQSS